MNIQTLRQLIRESILNEIDIDDVSDMCFATGSTHIMKTCSIGGDKFYLKFTDASLIEDVDPSLQILVEYLAYKVYSLYDGVRIPNVELVYDTKGQKVGLATSAIAGKMAGDVRTDPKKLAKMLTAGIYVDVFLANWDVIGTGSGNVIVKDDTATRIDPGGSLTFRAQGGRKGSKFGNKPGELETMLKPEFGGSGRVFQHGDLQEAGDTFASVPWGTIASILTSTSNEVYDELQGRGMKQLSKEWLSESKAIISTLAARHKEVLQHVKYMHKQINAALLFKQRISRLPNC